MQDTLLTRFLQFGIMALLASAIFAVFTALPTFLVWNWLMPSLFGLPRINYFEAWGLVFLAGALFRSGVSFEKEK